MTRGPAQDTGAPRIWFENRKIRNHLIEQLTQAKARKGQFRAFVTGIVQGLCTQADGTINRLNQRCGHAFDLRVVDSRKPVRQQNRRRQNAAQIMIDLAHRRPERSQVLLLAQRAPQVALHLGQHRLGHADLVITPGLRNPA